MGSFPFTSETKMKSTRSETFVVPVTGSQYAPEVIYLTRDGAAPESPFSAGPDAVTVVVASFVTSATVEVDVLDADGNYVNAAQITSAKVTRVVLDGLTGRVRVVSGGSSGNQAVTVRLA